MPSPLPVASRLPSGLNATDKTEPSCSTRATGNSLQAVTAASKAPGVWSQRQASIARAAPRSAAAAPPISRLIPTASAANWRPFASLAAASAWTAATSARARASRSATAALPACVAAASARVASASAFARASSAPARASRSASAATSARVAAASAWRVCSCASR